MDQKQVDLIVAQRKLSILNTELDVAISTGASRKSINEVLGGICEQLDVIKKTQAQLPDTKD